MKYQHSTIIGDFVLDEKNILSKAKKKEELNKLPKNKLPIVLEQLKKKEYFSEFYLANLKITKQKIKESVSEDQLIVQAISNVNELDRTINMLIKRLREWYALYCPEFEHKFIYQEKFVDLVLEKNRQELMKEVGVEETMGADLDKLHVQEMKQLALRVRELIFLRKEHEDYLEKVMKKYSPNILELAGITIGAKLLELGKSLKHLAFLPASTIQLLGAEKALFRHIKSGSRSPKYGVIFQHPFIQKAKKNERGKVARVLADKLSLCARLDYFKGEFKAAEYKKEIEEKFQ
ncbi:hypothetical protein COY27_01445 [Candidatus Woesearchaeota archaeon CG_4_10_14_0_2_um_filter_33_13]|nr:MAG: hypothetical protein COY27_01445 [Candidatus Woesearchaeota archaeon CG_4_10_14_0_2_um_filter_33_13]